MSSNTDIKKAVGLAYMSLLLDSGKYSDLLIECGGKEFKVHRSIVCMQSKPLAAHVDGVFSEATTGVISLPDDHPKTLERLITFLYTQDFDATPTAVDAIQEEFNQTTEEVSNILTVCARVYVMAEKYDIPPLKELAKTKYEAAIDKEWKTFALSISLKLMYEGLPSSDRALKDVAIRACAANFSELKDRGEFTELCKEIGEIPLHILTLSPVQLVCPSHGPSCLQYKNAYQNGNSGQFMCPSGGNWFYK